jgi:small-conductance mechanosensitive channel
MINNILQLTFLQNSILDYAIFLASFIFGIIVIHILKVIILKRLKVWADKSDTTIDDFLINIFEKKLLPLFYLGVFYIAAKNLTLSLSLKKIIDVMGVVLLTFFSIQLFIALIHYILEKRWTRKEVDIEREHSVEIILPIIKVIIWGIGITFLLDNLGFKISTVIAGLGIGGIAVALAAQTILGDLFSYFVIFFDRPFEVGDFIIVNDYLGSVEHIGIKTTRLRSLGGEQLVFSNTDLTNSRLRNYKRMDRRRVVFQFGVIYQTKLQELKEIPEIVTNIIKNVPDTVFDRAHFASYGDFSLNFEVVYYVLSRDYNKYMDIQQEINFKLNEELTKRGVEFAYPTQTLFLEKTQGKS